MVRGAKDNQDLVGNPPSHKLILSGVEKTFHSKTNAYEELVVQNLRREPHSSITVSRFRKLKSCCYVIAIPSGWHPCPNPNTNARFWSKKKALCTSFPVPAYCVIHSLPNHDSNPGVEGWYLSMFTTTLRSLQQCSDRMSYLNQMYEKKAMARAWAFAWLASSQMLAITNLTQISKQRFNELKSEVLQKAIL